MKYFFLGFAILSGFMSAMNHFMNDHHDCEYYLLSAIALALIAIAAKEKD